MNRTGTERARAVVTDRLGWTGNALDSVRLESAIHSCAAGLQQTRESYLERVERGSAPELRALVAQLAVGETYFFRDRAQFAVLDRLLERASSPLRVLCAGCASGEEPYSIAIRMLERGARGHVLGIDVNAPAIDLARKAVYSAWSLRDTPQATIDAWFHPEGKRFALSQAPKDLVELRHANLYADTLADLGQWDLVLCRNVLMYHSRPAAAEIVSKLSRQLVPGGYLFLGHAETLRGISDEFELHQAAGTFFYRRLGGPPSPPERISNRPAPATADDSWIDAIGSATDRIAALARGATSTQTPDKSDWMQMIREHVEAGAPLAALATIHHDIGVGAEQFHTLGDGVEEIGATKRRASRKRSPRSEKVYLKPTTSSRCARVRPGIPRPPSNAWSSSTSWTPSLRCPWCRLACIFGDWAMLPRGSNSWNWPTGYSSKRALSDCCYSAAASPGGRSSASATLSAGTKGSNERPLCQRAALRGPHAVRARRRDALADAVADRVHPDAQRHRRATPLPRASRGPTGGELRRTQR